MRWPRAYDGQTRIRRGFLFFPTCLGSEYRWLEVARWEEKFIDCRGYDSYWSGTKWIDDDAQATM